jgi:hypothetical protein
MTKNVAGYTVSRVGSGVGVIALVFDDGTSQTVDSTHVAFADMLEAIKDPRPSDIINEELTELLTVSDIVSAWQEDAEDDRATSVVIRDDVVYYGDRPVPSALSDYIVLLHNEGLSFSHLLNFIDRLMLNPSCASVEQLYGFLEYGKNRITEDGKFRAYKVVRDDYTDCHTGQHDNSPGQTLGMPRNAVDDDPNRTCSRGYHVCSRQYADGFFFRRGNRMVEVEVDPADVVSVPRDYNNTKMRVCAYTVVADITDKYEEGSDALQYEYKDSKKDNTVDLRAVAAKNRVSMDEFFTNTNVTEDGEEFDPEDYFYDDDDFDYDDGFPY